MAVVTALTLLSRQLAALAGSLRYGHALPDLESWDRGRLASFRHWGGVGLKTEERWGNGRNRGSRRHREIEGTGEAADTEK